MAFELCMVGPGRRNKATAQEQTAAKQWKRGTVCPLFTGVVLLHYFLHIQIYKVYMYI